MHPDRTDKLAEENQAVTQFEGEIRDLIRSRDVTWLRKAQPKAGGDAQNINSIIHRVAGASLAGIDNLIQELQRIRDLLENEGERVQREVAGYARLSQNAMKHVEAMADQMAQWKAGTTDNRETRSERD